MKSVNIAEAKAQLSELIALAEAGETICIMRRGHPVVQLSAVPAELEPLDLAALKSFTDTLPPQPESSVSLVRRMRDEARY